MIVAAHVAVDTTATLLLAGDRDGLRIVVRNLDDYPIYLGGADVTVGEGFQLNADESASLFIDTGDDLYAIAETGSAEVHTLVAGAA